MKKFLSLILTIILFSCSSHDKQNKHYKSLIKPNDLKKDIKYVKTQLEKMHPDLYWYISKEKLNAKFDSLINSTQTALSPNAFYFKISPIVAAVHQGHMSMSMLHILPSDSLKKKYKKSKNPLESFEYEYLDNKLYIVKNKSKNDSIIQIGSEIISINNIKPQDLYKKYIPTITSDGYNITGIPKFFARKINGYLVNELGLIDEANLLVKCADSMFNYTLKRNFKTVANNKNLDEVSKNKDGKDSLSNKQLTTPALKAKREIEREVAKKEEKKKTLFGYDEKNNKYSKEIFYPVANDSTITLLKIRDFSEGRIKVYDTIFTEFKRNNVQNLIIDLRGNPGGRLNEIHRLSQFLNDSSFVFIQPATITKRTTFFNMFKGKSVATKILAAPFFGSFALIRAVSTKRNDKGELQLSLASSKPKKPHNLAYKGKIYVITDGMTFSAAAIISSHLKGRKRATFVGNETGGAFNGTVAGIMPVLKLPKSKLKLRVGLMTIKPFQQINEEGYGVKPDIYIQPTIDDIVNKEDPELKWILNDIKQIKKEF